MFPTFFSVAVHLPPPRTGNFKPYFLISFRFSLSASISRHSLYFLFEVSSFNICFRINWRSHHLKPLNWDVFNAVLNALPCAFRTEFIPFDTDTRSYNDLVDNLFYGKYDAVAGDITIHANRSDYVDFTMTYTETGVSLIVPIRDERKSAWIFMRPLEKELWITVGGFFIYTGLVVWIIEHRVNKEFRGPPRQQVGMIFWFSFSTLVFAHREAGKQLIEIYGNRVGVCGTGADIELHSKLDIYVNSTAAST